MCVCLSLSAAAEAQSARGHVYPQRRTRKSGGYFPRGLTCVWCLLNSRRALSHLSLAACDARLEVQRDGLCEKRLAIWVKMLPCRFEVALEAGMVLVEGDGEGRKEVVWLGCGEGGCEGIGGRVCVFKRCVRSTYVLDL